MYSRPGVPLRCDQSPVVGWVVMIILLSVVIVHSLVCVHVRL